MTTGKFRHGPYDLLRKPQDEWLRLVDHVIRYESLDRTWDQMAYQFGHLPVGPIPKKNQASVIPHATGMSFFFSSGSAMCSRRKV